MNLVLGGGLTGQYKLRIYKDNIGNVGCADENLRDFTYKIEVSSITPLTGSVLGGTILTLTGINFGTTRNKNQVWIGESSKPCDVISATET